MKSLMLLVVMLAVICLCAASAMADVTLDSFTYPNDAAVQAVWGGSTAPTMAPVGGVPCMDIYGNNTGSGFVGVAAYSGGSWNLTGLTGLTFSAAASAAVGVYVNLYTSGGWSNYYQFSDPNTLTTQLQAAYCPLSGASIGGTPDLSNVTLIYIGSFLPPNSGAVNIYISDLVANTAPVPEPGSLLALGVGLLGMGGFVSRRRRS